MAFVKICGLRDPAVAEGMADLPVDAIGLMFAKSRRQVTVEQAREIVEAFRARMARPPLAVGVFVSPEFEELRRIAAAVPLDVVQLHDRESPETCRKIKDELDVRIYKVFSIKQEQEAVDEAGKTSASERIAPYAPWIDAAMLDTHDPIYGGGSGVPFNWAIIPEYRAAAQEHRLPLYVAGGLRIDTVGGLLADYAPDGVDVSSGVETDGVKDIEKIKAFVERVKGR